MHVVLVAHFDDDDDVVTKGSIMIKALIVLIAVFLIATFPATWLLMLFLGNLGVGLSYWGALPLGILVSTLISAAGAPKWVQV